MGVKSDKEGKVSIFLPKGYLSSLPYHPFNPPYDSRRRDIAIYIEKDIPFNDEFQLTIPFYYPYHPMGEELSLLHKKDDVPTTYLFWGYITHLHQFAITDGITHTPPPTSEEEGLFPHYLP